MAEADDFSGRLDELKLLWESDPTAKVYLQLSEEYRRLGQVDDAIRVLETTLAQRPRDPRGRVLLARCRLDLGQAAEASRILEEVVRLDPAHATASKLLLECYLQLQDADKASDRFNLYRLLNDRDPELDHLEFRLKRLQSGSAGADDEGPKSTPLAIPPAADRAVAAPVVAAAPPARFGDPFDLPPLPAAGGAPAGAPFAWLMPAAPAAAPVFPESAPVFAAPAPAPEPFSAPVPAAPPAAPSFSSDPFGELLPPPAPASTFDLFEMLQPAAPSSPAPTLEDFWLTPAPAAFEPAAEPESALLGLGYGGETLPGAVVEESPGIEPAFAEPAFAEPAFAEPSFVPEPPAYASESVLLAEPEVQTPVDEIPAIDESAPIFTGDASAPPSDAPPSDAPPSDAPSSEAPLFDAPYAYEPPSDAPPSYTPPAAAFEPVGATHTSAFELPVMPAPREAAAPEPVDSAPAEDLAATATLGDLYLLQGHAEEAERIYQRVLAGDPANPTALAGMERVRALSGAWFGAPASAVAPPQPQEPAVVEVPLAAPERPPAVLETPARRAALTAGDLLADRSAGYELPAGLTAKKILVLKRYLQHLRSTRPAYVQ